jgi:hypothetical protein
MDKAKRDAMEMAAKAAGYRVCHFESDLRAYVADDRTGERFYWAPRNDCGDALRLMADLGMSIHREKTVVMVRDHTEAYLSGPHWIEEDVRNNGCRDALRSVVFRAAVKIGQALSRSAA